MRKIRLFFILISFILFLSGCTEATTTYNFTVRKDSYIVSSDDLVMISYKTDNDGKLIELSIDRLLTIEEMMLLNPSVDFDYELEGFDGDIFIEPDNVCTEISNDVLVPINIEIGNTRYKFDNDDCMYKTVDNHNDFKPGYAQNYELTDTIPIASHVSINIIVYNPTELVSFVEIMELQNSYKTVGVNNIRISRNRVYFDTEIINYYRDMSVFEQLYMKHQEAEGAINEINGIATDINLMDLDSLTEINPLIDEFETIYEKEITAIEELQEEIGVAFSVQSEDIQEEEDTEE